MKKSLAIVSLACFASVLSWGQAKIGGTAIVGGSAKIATNAGGGGGPNTWSNLQFVYSSPGSTNPFNLPALTTVLAHDLIAVGIEVEGGTTATTITSVSGGCAGTWTHVANSNIYSGSSRSLDFYYCDNASAGSNVVVQITAAGGFGTGLRGMGWKITPSTGSSSVDANATRTDTTTNPAPGISLVPTSTDFIVTAAAASGTVNSMTAGNGCTSNYNSGGFGAAYCTASASAAYPASWALSATSVILSAVAFK